MFEALPLTTDEQSALDSRLKDYEKFIGTTCVDNAKGQLHVFGITGKKEAASVGKAAKVIEKELSEVA